MSISIFATLFSLVLIFSNSAFGHIECKKSLNRIQLPTEELNLLRQKAIDPSDTLITRYPEDNQSSSYFESYRTNMRTMLKYLDRIIYSSMAGNSDRDSGQIDWIQLLKDCHKLLDYRSPSPGEFHQWEVTHNIRPQAEVYANLILEQNHLGPLPIGHVFIEGISPQNLPTNDPGGKHIYPNPNQRSEYLREAQVSFEKIIDSLRRHDSLEVIENEIGRYYYLLVNLRIFPNVNNSLFMGQVNYFLNLFGHPGISHGDLDHLFMRINSQQATTLWPKVLKGEIPSAKSLGITIDSGLTVK